MNVRHAVAAAAAAAAFFILLERRANRRCARRNKSSPYSASASSSYAPAVPAAELDHPIICSGVRGGGAHKQEQVMAKA